MRIFLSLLTIVALAAQAFFAYAWGRTDVTERFLDIHSAFHGGAPAWVRLAFSLDYYWLVFTSFVFTGAYFYSYTREKQFSPFYLSSDLITIFFVNVIRDVSTPRYGTIQCLKY